MQVGHSGSGLTGGAMIISSAFPMPSERPSAHGAYSLDFFWSRKIRRRWSCCGWYHSGRCAHGGGCFLIGCCGSPMLAVYVTLFGSRALGVGKPLTALVTLVSVDCGYWCLSRRLAHVVSVAL